MELKQVVRQYRDWLNANFDLLTPLQRLFAKLLDHSFTDLCLWFYPKFEEENPRHNRQNEIDARAQLALTQIHWIEAVDVVGVPRPKNRFTFDEICEFMNWHNDALRDWIIDSLPIDRHEELVRKQKEWMLDVRAMAG